MKRNRREKALVTVISTLMCMLAGGLGGFAMTNIIPKNAPVWQEIFGIVGVVVLFYIAVMLQIFVHETGHMIGGLLSGYEFFSIRFFCFLFMKEEGKLCVKKYSIAGTGGQCLMTPPAVDGSSPVGLYNLGGCLANGILSVISILLAILCQEMVILRTWFIILAVVGFCLGIINGIPLKTLANDGYNAITLKDRPQSRKAFERSMYAVKELAQGKRVKDMPAELFDYEIGFYEIDDNLLVTNAIMTMNYHMDKKNFEKAYELSKYLYENVELVDVHKMVTITEQITCILLWDIANQENSIKKDGAPEEIVTKVNDKIESILTKENQKLLKLHKAQPSVHRMWYIYELLYRRDMEKAEKHKQTFVKIARSYPYPREIEGERELMDLALECFKDKTCRFCKFMQR